ncbi:hypothetical protein BCR37DRAFT_379029 [Protomyces lactucae-debilis]|uniref:Uncharacterized protein n=1 Tax=Protomyces lactucae-debilis TaxID=2754530 RepID=A0A1Y2FJW0_PROLT|nr:uncharacterized protein BCR37DRAFT_379029 [Protomyces lactucae-debilis]ORY83075.1 hypothetical protein BCR37DRAFT_379029 [Protomyces lactucae-debilis]
MPQSTCTAYRMTRERRPGWFVVHCTLSTGLYCQFMMDHAHHVGASRWVNRQRMGCLPLDFVARLIYAEPYSVAELVMAVSQMAHSASDWTESSQETRPMLHGCYEDCVSQLGAGVQKGSAVRVRSGMAVNVGCDDCTSSSTRDNSPSLASKKPTMHLFRGVAGQHCCSPVNGSLSLKNSSAGVGGIGVGSGCCVCAVAIIAGCERAEAALSSVTLCLGYIVTSHMA